MATKRKRLEITIEEKIKAIERVEKAELMKKVLAELNVGNAVKACRLKKKI